MKKRDIEHRTSNIEHPTSKKDVASLLELYPAARHSNPEVSSG